MKREALEKLGLSKEVIDQVMAEYGNSINKLKADYELATTEKEAYKKSVEEANAKIAEFSKLDIETIKKQSGEWEKKAKETEAAYNKRIIELQKEHILEREISKLKPRDVNDIKRLLATDKITLDGEKLVGFEEQAKLLKESKGYLFEAEQQTQAKFGGENNLPKSGGISEVERMARKAAGLPEIPVK